MKSIPQNTLGGDSRELAKLDSDGLAPEHVGNAYEVLLRGLDHAKAASALDAFKKKHAQILDKQKELQELERVARRKHRYAALMYFVERGAIDPESSARDDKFSPIPGVGCEGQQVADYDKGEVLGWVMKNAPMYLTVDWKAFENDLIKAGGFSVPNPPPARVVRKVREVLMSGWETFYERVGEVEFEDETERESLIKDASAFYGVSESEAINRIKQDLGIEV